MRLEGDTLIVKTQPAYYYPEVSGDKCCTAGLVDAPKWDAIIVADPHYIRIDWGGDLVAEDEPKPGPVFPITWLGSLGSVLGQVRVMICFRVPEKGS